MDMSKRLRRKFIAVAMASVTVVLAGIIAAINVANYLDVCNQADARLALIQQNGGELSADGADMGSASGGLADAPDTEGDAAASGANTISSSETDDVAASSADSEQKPRPEEGNPQPSADPAAKEDSVEEPKAAGSAPGAVIPRGNAAEMAFEMRYFTVCLDDDGSASSVNVDKIAAVSADQAEEMAQGIAAGSSGFSGVYRYSAVQQSDGTVRCVFLDCSRDLGNFASFLTASVAISLVGLVLVFVLVFVLSKAAIRPVVESYQKQKAFITDASHEIKTPLAVISAANEVQEMENGETEWSRSIAEQVRRLSGLTEQLVQLARMDEGVSRFAKEEVDFSELVGEMAEPFYQLAQQRGKTLVVDIAEEVQVQGDAAALSQVVELLLDNATRYAKEGTQIQLQLRKHGRRVQLSVSNEVERMPKGNLDKLFERFYRDDASRSSQTGGSGVGLSVVRSIAEAHGGTAKVAAQGNVITFTVTL